jgi:SAM-dependent methyltransferase
VDEASADPRRWPRAKLLARLYDWEHDSFSDDVDLYLSLAKRTGGPVLEPACGSGRVLEPLARRGLRAAGFDASAEMLARARRRVDDVQSRVALEQATLADPLPAGEFRLVLLALDALGLVDEPRAQIDLLWRIRASLASDGLLALDLVHEALLWDQPEGVPVLQHSAADDEIAARVTKWIVRRVHPATQHLDLDSFYDIVWPDGGFSRIEDSVRVRFFSRYEVELLLAAAGLRIEGVYGDYTLGAFEDASPRMIVLANRDA